LIEVADDFAPLVGGAEGFDRRAAAKAGQRAGELKQA
jgi:hypothetical protein